MSPDPVSHSSRSPAMPLGTGRRHLPLRLLSQALKLGAVLLQDGTCSYHWGRRVRGPEARCKERLQSECPVFSASPVRGRVSWC